MRPLMTKEWAWVSRTGNPGVPRIDNLGAWKKEGEERVKPTQGWISLATYYVTLANYLTSVSQFLHLRDNTDHRKMRHVCHKCLGKQVLNRQSYIHMWIIKEVSYSCPLTKSTGPWPRSQSHHAGGWTFIKLKKTWWDCSFRLLMFPNSCCISLETDETFRTNGSFRSLRYLTYRQNHFLKISFWFFQNVFAMYDLCLHILAKTICCNSVPMWNLLGTIISGAW